MTTKSMAVKCADKYEAQKVASMVLGKGRRTYVAAILDIIGSEVVVSLRDGSAHSMVLESAKDAETLAGYMQSVLEGSHRILSAEPAGSAVRMSKG